MPTYEYEFQDTGERIDVFQKMSDPKFTEIDGRPVTRLISAPSSSQISMGELGHQDKYPYLSNAHYNLQGARMAKDPKSGRMKPVIESRKHEKEVAALNDLVKE